MRGTWLWHVEVSCAREIYCAGGSDLKSIGCDLEGRLILYPDSCTRLPIKTAAAHRNTRARPGLNSQQSQSEEGEKNGRRSRTRWIPRRETAARSTIRSLRFTSEMTKRFSQTFPSVSLRASKESFAVIDRLSKLILIGESSSLPSISPINKNISVYSQTS